MRFFALAAPFFGAFGDRWSPDTLARFTGWLRPHVPEGGSILDLGGGTGALAARLADALSAGAVVLDPSPEMLARMKPHPHVEARLGVAERMPFANASFDAVVISDAFHHFPDQDGAAREMARVVRPGGGVLVLEFDPRGLMRPIVAAEKLLGEPGAFLTPDEMCAFMATRGISGRCEKTGSIGYYFLGEVPPANEPGTPD